MSETPGTKDIRAAVTVLLDDKSVQSITDDVIAKYERELNRLTSFCGGRDIYTVQSLTWELLTAFTMSWKSLYPCSLTRTVVRTRCRGFLRSAMEDTSPATRATALQGQAPRAYRSTPHGARATDACAKEQVPLGSQEMVRTQVIQECDFQRLSSGLTSGAEKTNRCITLQARLPSDVAAYVHRSRSMASNPPSDFQSVGVCRFRLPS